MAPASRLAHALPMRGQIKRFREFAGFTQEQVGARLGITPQQVSKIERGISDTPTSTIDGMAELFGSTTSDLLSTIFSTKPIFTIEVRGRARVADVAWDGPIVAAYLDLEVLGQRPYALRLLIRTTDPAYQALLTTGHALLIEGTIERAENLAGDLVLIVDLVGLRPA